MLNINTNIGAISSRRALVRNSQALAQSFQRLSTGLRVNSAKDDAAGLAIANRLTAQLTGINQAIRNANDSISMVQTADSAMSEQQNMLQRLRELAVQSSSDTNTSADRAAIQAEADALVSEIDRIASQTTFNGRNLLDGSLSNIKLQVGATGSDNLSFTIANSRAYSLGAVYTHTTTSAVTTDALASNGLITINGIAIDATDQNDDPFSSVNQDGSAIAKAAAINKTTHEHGVTATAEATSVNVNIATGETFNAGDVTINGASVAALTYLTNDTDSSLRNAINALSAQTGVVATVSGDQLVLTASDGRNIDIGGTDPNGAADGATFNAHNTAVITAKITLKSESSITVGSATSVGARVGFAAAGNSITTTRNTNVNTMSLTSQTGATSAIDAIDDAIAALSSRQASLGALLNRMDNAVSNLSAAAENTAAARSRIQDADFATETANFSKNQILQQASTAMLAQANVAGQIALQLLG